MRAHRNTDGVRMSFYVTGRRLGVDFGLLSADSRPLTERQLRAVLEPEAWRKTATEYRDLVDSRLFGLGRERYAQLLDLLLALRRPLLAKDLDPVKVSDTLTAGLSPVDEYLVQQAARDFENLAAVQKLFDDLTAANAAVRDFLTHYTAYLRAHVKFQLDRVQARADAAAGHAEKITEAAATYHRAIEAERHAEAQRDARRDEGETLQGRLAGLKNSEEYKAQGRIEDKRREMLAGAREVGGQRRGLDRDRRELGAARGGGRQARRAAPLRPETTRTGTQATWPTPRSGPALPTTASARSIPAMTCCRWPGRGSLPVAMTWARSASCCRRSGTPPANAASASKTSATSRPPSDGRNRLVRPRRPASPRPAVRPRTN